MNSREPSRMSLNTIFRNTVKEPRTYIANKKNVTDEQNWERLNQIANRWKLFSFSSLSLVAKPVLFLCHEMRWFCFI